MTQQAALLSALTRSLVSGDETLPLADRLVGAVCHVLAARGGSLSVGYRPEDRTVLAATDPTATRIEEFQDVLREGPSLEAFTTGSPVAVPLREQEVRWPNLHRSLHEHGDRVRLMAVPMRPDGAVVGVLALHRSRHDPVDVRIGDAQFLADATGVALLGRLADQDADDELWLTRDRVNQATGMVVAQLRLPPVDALAVLRAHAFAQGASVAAVAS